MTLGFARRYSTGSALLIVPWIWAASQTSPENGGYLAFGAFIAIIGSLGVVLLTPDTGDVQSHARATPSQLASIVAYLVLSSVLAFVLWTELSQLKLSPIQEYLTSSAIQFVSLTAIPLILLSTRIWRWPTQKVSLSNLNLIYIAAFTTVFAAFTGPGMLFNFNALSDEWLTLLIAAETIVLALGEEVLFRVLLLSYLASLLQSRLQAVAISAILFALFHIPALVTQNPSVSAVSWLSSNVAVPTVLLAVGVFLGAIWIRTQSIAVVVLAHAAYNLSFRLESFRSVWPGT
jgi:membrane protease YdiL (CAAX protease family)